VSAGIAHQRGQVTQRRATAVDLGATFVLRGERGAVP
jgi:hypothetical protein